MPKLIDLTGKRYGKLVVISRAKNLGNSVAWNCMCDCGNECVIRADHLREGRTISCSKCGRERQTISVTKHGEYKSPLYDVWVSMKQRCFNPRSEEYHNYGARGITVCDEWLDYSNFREWAQDKYNQGLTIDRINNNGNYEPSNCRFTTYYAQSINKRSNRIITYGGETKTVTELARKYGFKPHVVFKRLKIGWTIERALTEPLHTEMIHR